MILSLKYGHFQKPKNAILSGKKPNLRFIFFNFFFMRAVRSLLSVRRKKRFKKRTFIGHTPVTRVNTVWGKSHALYNGVYVLVLFNQMLQSPYFCYCSSKLDFIDSNSENLGIILITFMEKYAEQNKELWTFESDLGVS